MMQVIARGSPCLLAIRQCTGRAGWAGQLHRSDHPRCRRVAPITPDDSDTPDADRQGHARDVPRHIARHNSERGDATAPQNYGYMSELFGSERHKQLSPGIRMEQLNEILVHYLGLLDDGVMPNRGPPPHFVRDGYTVPYPAVKVQQQASAHEGSPVASRRHAGATPAVTVAPAILVASKGVRPVAVLHAALYDEGVAFVLNLLDQHTDPRKARARLRAEVRYLVAAAARQASALHARVDMTNENAWQAMTEVVLRSPFFLEQLGSFCAFNLSMVP